MDKDKEVPAVAGAVKPVEVVLIPIATLVMEEMLDMPFVFWVVY